MGDAEIESEGKFTYLNSLIDNNGTMDAEVDRHIAVHPKHLLPCTLLSLKIDI